MKYAIIFHGTAGHANENWFPWLKKELKKYNYGVIVPQFPTPENQSPESWLKVFEEYNDKKYLNEDTLLIGHSLGGGFLLWVLEKISKKINTKTNAKVKAAFFVAASIGVKPIKYYETDKLFVEKSFEWHNIKNSAKNFFVFHSEDDPLVCIGNGEKLAAKLGVKLIKVKDAGHFNKAAGYDKFELLLEKILSVL